MYELIQKVNNKVVKLQKAKTSDGYVNGKFPGFDDAYPCLTEFSTRFWRKTWHEERLLEYIRVNDLWLTTQLFINNNSGLFDLCYYSYIESVTLMLQSYLDDTAYVIINDEIVHTQKFYGDLIQINFDYVLMIGDKVKIRLSSEQSFDFQIKYRLVG